MIHFTAGPSQVYPTLPQYLQEAIQEDVMSISHRGDAFMDIYAHMDKGLRALLNVPEDYQIFVFSSATEIWERISENCIEKESFHLVNGNFSNSFRKIVRLAGKEAKSHEIEEGLGFDIESIDVPASSELIATIANESSTGVMLPAKDLATLRKHYPEKLIVSDAVSIVPTWEGRIEDLDGLYFSVQKGFGLPAGLAVLIMSPRMLARGLELEAKGQMVGTYHRFSALLEKSKKNQTPATPNVLGIYLLGKVCEDMVQKLPAIKQANEEKYSLLCNWIEKHPDLEFAIDNPEHRSNTVVVIKHNYTDGKAKIEALAAKGFAISTGYGKYKGSQFRIANFPATSVEDMKALIAAFG